MHIIFNDDPKSVAKSDNMVIVTSAENNPGWWNLYRYGHQFGTYKLPIMLLGEYDLWSAEGIADRIRFFEPDRVVMTDEAYRQTFKLLFDLSYVPHTTDQAD